MAIQIYLFLPWSEPPREYSVIIEELLGYFQEFFSAGNLNVNSQLAVLARENVCPGNSIKKHHRVARFVTFS